MTTGPWTTPEDIRAEVERHWSRGALLANVLTDRFAACREASSSRYGDSFGDATGAEPGAGSGRLGPTPLAFPLRLRLRRPRSADLSVAFEAARRWIADLEAGARLAGRPGYEIAWDEINTRPLGRNRIPSGLLLPSLDDALAVIGKQEAVADAIALADATLARFPGLAGWLIARPLALVEHSAAWPQLLDCITWFVRHPRSGLYARQIDVAGIDSKFIEQHKTILAELLDCVLSDDAVTKTAVGAAAFELRYGLAAKPQMVRMRALDPRLVIGGLTDVTARIEEIAQLQPAMEQVIIVENEITGLAYPRTAGAMLMFGGGYAISQLAAIGWLQACPITYWGDIDTNGFAILDRLRSIFPHARSMLMDRETLLAHRAAWVFEATPHVADLVNLTPEEAALYDDLRRDRLGQGVRLEQERISLRLAGRHT